MLRARHVLLSGADDRFAALLRRHDLPALRRRAVTTLQVNMGRLCNQSCRHCHVDAGPARTERMDERVMQRLLVLLEQSPSVADVDITGGAPELNPHFRQLVTGARAAGRSVMVRCNLTVLHEPHQSDLPAFYAAHGVHVVASLPCYTEDNVDRQRGGGVFELSIAALQRLNAVGYGAAQGAPCATADAAGPDVVGDGPGTPHDGGSSGPHGAHRAPLRLDLVYNPLGPSLPPPQQKLEADYHLRLAADHGVVFDRLFTLANMPIHRFADDLSRQGRLEPYHALLEDSFNPGAVDAVMCRDLVSVDWNGRLAECDFHQMLELPLGAGPASIFDVQSLEALAGQPVTTASHCLGCTAGQGSSCGGALTDAPA